jgi:hypothetical protein
MVGSITGTLPSMLAALFVPQALEGSGGNTPAPPGGNTADTPLGSTTNNGNGTQTVVGVGGPFDINIPGL